jgi:exopolysaccharide biosynthesis polyprenyl glycosylphosphotransferase
MGRFLGSRTNYQDEAVDRAGVGAAAADPPKEKPARARRTVLRSRRQRLIVLPAGQRRPAPALAARYRLLSWGAAPLFVAGDIAGFAAGVVATDADGRAVFVLVTIMALFAAGGLYRSRLTLSLLDDLPPIAGRVLTAAASVALATHVLHSSAPLVWESVLAGAGGIIAARAGAYALVRWCRARRYVSYRTLILGGGVVSGHLVARLQQHPEYGLEPVAVLDPDPLLQGEQIALPVLVDVESLADVIKRLDVHVVVIAFGSVRESQIVEVLRARERTDTEIFLVPRLFEVTGRGREIDHVWGIPLVRLRRAAFRRSSRMLKRMFDVVVAVMGLVVAAPVMVVCAVAVRVSVSPRVLFRQPRVGVDGRPFTLLKFRTLSDTHDGEAGTRWSVAGDDRMTRTGRILRRLSLDELPQLINVLRGEMSLVGPRPERPHFVDQFARSYPHYHARHRMPSGLTGWAQVHGLRGDTSIDDRARFDNVYIDSWSLWGDVSILLRTAGQVLGARGG